MFNQRVTSQQERWVIFLVSWMLASAIFNLILAAIIIAGLPGVLTWAIWLLVGINIAFSGLALIAMALAKRSLWPGRLNPGAHG